MSRSRSLKERLLTARRRIAVGVVPAARVVPARDRQACRQFRPKGHLRCSGAALSCAGLLLAAALAACGTASADTRDRTADTRTAATERGDTARSRGRSAAPKRTPARLEVVDATAFTITEQARISGDERTQYDAAVRLLEEQRYAEGVTLMLQVAERAPELTAPQINLGIAYERLGDLAKAEASFGKALELNPNHPVVHDELGLLYRETGRFTEARASYEKALAIHPGFHFAHRNLAILCDVYLDDLPCALTHYEAYAQAEPDDKEVRKWIADLHNRLGR